MKVLNKQCYQNQESGLSRWRRDWWKQATPPQWENSSSGLGFHLFRACRTFSSLARHLRWGSELFPDRCRQVIRTLDSCIKSAGSDTTSHAWLRLSDDRSTERWASNLLIGMRLKSAWLPLQTTCFMARIHARRHLTFRHCARLRLGIGVRWLKNWKGTHD